MVVNGGERKGRRGREMVRSLMVRLEFVLFSIGLKRWSN